jgi:single-strand DNA-binding protein
MRGVNHLILVGRIGREPELRHGRNGTAWCSLSVATDRSVRQERGWSTTTDWHRVRAFGRTAELCHERLRRGSLVAIEGPITYDTWRDDSGNGRTVAVVLASRVELLAEATQIDPSLPGTVGLGAAGNT